MKNLLIALFAGMTLCGGVSRSFADGTLPGMFESHESLKKAPKGAVEVAKGTYTSTLLGRPVPYRVFVPAKPEWQREQYKFQKKDKESPRGMPVAICTLNLTCPAPRPSSAADREIIEDLIKRQFIVVAVDFTGGEVTDPLEWSKDIHGLIHVFGGSWHSEQPWYTENRKELLNIPGPHAGKEFPAFSSPDPAAGESLPVNQNRIYVVPPGYTVDYYHIFNADSGAGNRPELFFDIIYPMPAEKTEKLPILLEQSSTNFGNDVINANAFVLYSWLFNGYAVASTANMPPREDNIQLYSISQAIRYLRWKKEEFSLNGIVGTCGISKSARRIFRESVFVPHPTPVDDMQYGDESSDVVITMPAVGAGGFLDDRVYPDFPIWEHLPEDAPAVVLTYNHLNVGEGKKEKLVRDAYLANGWEDRLFYRDVPLGGHEYDIYDLNAIMAFWDRFCK